MKAAPAGQGEGHQMNHKEIQVQDISPTAPGWTPRSVKRAVPALAAATVLTLGLTGCGANAPEQTAAAPAAATTSAPTADDLFLAVVRDEIPGAGAAHIAVGKAVCEALDDGMTLDQVARTMLSAAGDQFTPAQLGTLAGAGVGAYCPEHNGEIGGDPA